MEASPEPVPGKPRHERPPVSPVGDFVTRDGEVYYRISSYHRLTPFLMTLASDTDLWMFIASGGGLTAGRVDPDGSLFPYLTVDRLHEAHHHTGPLTLIRIDRKDGVRVLWEPFSASGAETTNIARCLYKNTVGNRLVFEEVNHELDLTFSYSWAASDEFGWVRTAVLENRNLGPVRVCLLDGLRNVLPHGAPVALYQQSSNLVDAYKKSEVDAETGLGIFSLSAGITDRAEALESLRANTFWCCGLEDFQVHLSAAAIEAFRNGRVVARDRILNGARGNYMVSCELELEPGASTSWHLVGDSGRDHVQIIALRRRLLQDAGLADCITERMAQTTENLRRNVASADGLQASGHPEGWSHHFANVLFNNMRGGIFAHNYDIPVADFSDFLAVRNRDVARRQQSLISAQPATLTLTALRDLARQTDDTDFVRLCYEYLPLHFGRRHGDPSRPWNRFSIRVRKPTGERALNYEGNWRDIFQNWEALCFSFPGFLPSIVAKFVNASTVDGFNPYRLTRDGVDWETVNPDDPWSNIGYWGDHQIIYLLKLLEGMVGYDPAVFADLLGQECFSYADIPYRLKPYAAIVADPRATITFDTEHATLIDQRVARLGTDGKLVTGPGGSVHHVNLFEKLLVPALAKLSNLIPDAGIWMNTQRPEWNDANNALGGGGVSVVTLCYLRRYLAFLATELAGVSATSLPVSTEVAAWFGRTAATLVNERAQLHAESLDARGRKRLLDALGGAFSQYRDAVYTHGFTGKVEVSIQEVVSLCRVALEYIEWGIHANRRDDGLYHAYNLLDFTRDGNAVEVGHLQEMLEGQVAAISSGLLDPEESLRILDQLFAGALYRADQHSFMLYPERELPGFLGKNVVPDTEALAIDLVKDLLAAGDGMVLARDDDGVCRFHGAFRNAGDLAVALDDLALRDGWAAKVAQDRDAVLALYEVVFRHRFYTGRSGVMYGYEGLGCIYWHMVAKLLLAVQEVVLRAERDNRPPATRAALTRMYYRIRAGLGYEKSVVEFGAFPTDPYSHTPAGGGAKQPGMTGQVKEEILTRFGELGVRVEKGTVRFQPTLLRPREFTEQPVAFRYYDVEGEARVIDLSPGSLVFTYCQVPVVYERTPAKDWIRVVLADGTVVQRSGNVLDAHESAELFARSGRIERIHLGIPGEWLDGY